MATLGLLRRLQPLRTHVPQPSSRVLRHRYLPRNANPSLSPAASVVTVSTCDESPRPRVAMHLQSTLEEESTAGKSEAFMTFYFQDEYGEDQDVAWTFKYYKPTDNLLRRLHGFCHPKSDDEYTVALGRFLSSLLLQEFLLERKKAREKEEREAAKKRQSELQVALRVVNDRAETPWSYEDVISLVECRERGICLEDMSGPLNMPPARVEQALEQLGGYKYGLEDADKEISAESADEIFRYRFESIWQSLLKSKMTKDWADTLRDRTPDMWRRDILSCIPSAVKSLLISSRRPTFEQLKSLPLSETTNAGVFARLAESRYGDQDTRKRLVEIGSASSYEIGLKGRVAQLRRKSTRGRKGDFEHGGLQWPGTFVALMEMEMESPESDDIVHVRETVVLAEAILTIWLGALAEPSDKFKKAFPWNFEQKYSDGWTLRNCLEKDIELPYDENVKRAMEAFEGITKIRID